MVKAQPSTLSKMPRFAPALLALMLLASWQVSAGPWEEGYAAYQRKDYTTAVAKWRLVADKGNAKAQSLMGHMYFFGQGVKQDYPQAITWLNLAAAQGEPKAHFKLGSMHENAQGFTQNKLMAAVYYTMAAELQHPEASEALLRVSTQLSPKETATASRLAQTCIKRAYKACESVLNP
jgi:TPR repeat protein